MGSERLDLGSERPNLGSERPDLGSERPYLGSEKPDLGSGWPDLGSERPDLGSERSDLGSERPVLRLQGGGRTRTDGNWRKLPYVESSAPLGPLSKNGHSVAAAFVITASPIATVVFAV